MVVVLLIVGLLVHICVVVQCQDNYYENVTYRDGYPCIHVKLRLTATISYRTDSELSNVSRRSVDIVGNNFTTVASSCVINPQIGNASINISWPSNDDNDGPYYSLLIVFIANFPEGWYVSKMELNVITTDNPEFEDATEGDFTLRNEKSLTVDNITLDKSYKCDSSVTHSFSSGNSNSTAQLRISDMQLQAFQFPDNHGNFGSADMQCVEDVDDSKLIPIIVGTVITAVLLIALVLYIIARVVHHRRDSRRSLST